YNACNPQHPTPILQIHGTNDQAVPYLGDPTWTESIDDVLQYWVDYNNCNTTPTITLVAFSFSVEYVVYDGGNNSVTTEHFKIYGGDHDWPGVWGNMDIHASAEVWKFFYKYDINGLIGTSTLIENTSIKDKRLIKITDIFGRETKRTSNTLLFYIYDDGTVEKIITLEK
ncbi:MAG: alpha/beta hydrolase family esterase, partial [Flavobacteriales bacterium]